jgi:6-phosphogluconolactonase
MMIDDRLTRRTLLGAAAVAALPGGALAAPAATRALYAGGYNKEGGAGLLPLDYAPAAGAWRAHAAVAVAPDASWGVRHPRLGLHYLVQEGSAGKVAVLRQRGGAWQRLALVDSGGADPCHLALSADGGALAVANYSSGSVALIALDPRTGLPRAAAQVVPHRGRGPDAERQAAPHAHWVGFSPDRQWLWSVDLGADTIFAHRLDAAGTRLGETRAAYRAVAGSGPRHLAFHPRLPLAYLVAELDNSVTVLRRGADSRFTALARHSTLPAGFAGKSQAGAIAIDPRGRWLYASNRGADSVAVYAIAADGALTPIQHIAGGGRWPRHLRVLDSRLLVANERSGTIDGFSVGRDGRLSPFGAAARAPGVAFIGEA